MLTEYIRAAMRRAHYEILSDDASYYGEIPGFHGVWANAKTLEQCRDELEEVLESWLLYRIAEKLEVPVVNGIRLTVKRVKVPASASSRAR